MQQYSCVVLKLLSKDYFNVIAMTRGSVNKFIYWPTIFFDVWLECDIQWQLYKK